MMTCGVLVGADQNSSWLLPWWWKHYSAHNTFPVTFVDFGLPSEMRAWCAERGEVRTLELDRSFIASPSAVSPQLALEWEGLYGKNVWQARQGWFCKPFAMLLSPYEITVWTDLDCEIRGSLSSLFTHLHEDAGLSVARDPSREGMVNTGVLLFRKNIRVLQTWADLCKTASDQFIGDDYLLSLLAAQEDKVQDLPEIYHTIAGREGHESALIVHWMANWGKLFIELNGGMEEYRKAIR